MNRTRKLLILAVLLVAVSAAAFGVSRYEEKKEQIKNSNEIILAIDPDTVTALDWEYENDAESEDEDAEETEEASAEESSETEEDGPVSLAFHKDGEWSYDDDAAFPVDEEAILNLLETFREFEADFTIDDVEDLSQYGLDDPIATIHITADGQDYDISLGGYSSLDAERYLSIGDGKVYLAAVDPLDSYTVTLSDLILNDDIPDVSEAEEVSFSGSENYTLTYGGDESLSPCEEDVYYTDGKPLDTTNVHTYLTTLGYVPLSDYASYNVTDEELAAWGLDDPELTVTVTYIPEPEESEETGEETEETEEAEEADPVTFTVSIGRNREELAAYEAAEEEKAAAEAEAEAEDGSAEEAEETADDETEEEEEITVTAYIRLNDSPIVYVLSDSSYEALMAASYNDLRHSDLMTASFDDISSIGVKIEDVTYTISSEWQDAEGNVVEAPTEDEETELEEDEESDETAAPTHVWHYGADGELDISALRSAVLSLAAEDAESFTDEAPSDKEEISLTFYTNLKDFPEITISLYRYDADSCLAVLNGESVALVPRSQVVDLIEEVYNIVLEKSES